MKIQHTILTAIVALGLSAPLFASTPLPSPVNPAVSEQDTLGTESFVPRVAKLGFEGTMLFGNGLRVDFVEFGNTAEVIGLRAGDVITKVNGVAVQTPDHFRALLMSSIETQQGQVELEVAGPNLGAQNRTVFCNVRGNIVRIDAGPSY